jgi:hypothetical protein
MRTDHARWSERRLYHDAVQFALRGANAQHFRVPDRTELQQKETSNERHEDKPFDSDSVPVLWS